MTVNSVLWFSVFYSRVPNWQFQPEQPGTQPQLQGRGVDPPAEHVPEFLHGLDPQTPERKRKVKSTTTTVAMIISHVARERLNKQLRCVRNVHMLARDVFDVAKR